MDALPQTPHAPLDTLGIDVGALSDYELVETMVAGRRLASRAQAAELAAVAELARRRFAETADRGTVVEVLSPADYVHDEVATALTLTPASADGLIRFATELTERLPATFAALATGEIDYARARTVWYATDQLDDQLTRTIEAMALAKAPEQTTGQIRAKIRRLVKRLAPEAADQRRAEAERRRGVELIETDDGTAQLRGVDLPADAAGTAYGRVNAIATGLKRDGDHRKIDQLRADVFLGLLRGTFTPGEPPADTTDRPIGTPVTRDPDWTGMDVAVADVIAEVARTELATITDALAEPHHEVGDLITQTGARINRSLADRSVPGRPLTGRPLTNEFSPTATEGIPEPLYDIGDLIAQAAVHINRALADLRSRWCVPGRATPPAARPDSGDGAGIAAGSGSGAGPRHGVAAYRPPAAMRRLIEYRDRRCCYSGCRRPVRHCDADHTIPFHRGGATCPCNLAMLCRRHHRTKQTAQWRIDQLWPGVILWITPTGHWKITTPADRE